MEPPGLLQGYEQKPYVVQAMQGARRHLRPGLKQAGGPGGQNLVCARHVYLNLRVVTAFIRIAMRPAPPWPIHKDYQYCLFVKQFLSKTNKNKGLSIQGRYNVQTHGLLYKQSFDCDT
jgi:hypothetical protein